MKILAELFSGCNSKKDLGMSTESRFADLDSELIFNLGNVRKANEALATKDISATTRREIYDRMLRAVGREVFSGNISYEIFSALELQARTFYLMYHLHGMNNLLQLSTALINHVGMVTIETKNRNLAAAVWEPKILERVKKAEQSIRTEGIQPHIVSLAFGGNEPALLLSGLRENSPVIHIKKQSDGDCKYLGTDINTLNKSDIIIVDDVVRTGEALNDTILFLEKKHTPRSIRSLIIHRY